jgi:hypothetical protein
MHERGGVKLVGSRSSVDTSVAIARITAGRGYHMNEGGTECTDSAPIYLPVAAMFRRELPETCNPG